MGIGLMAVGFLVYSSLSIFSVCTEYLIAGLGGLTGFPIIATTHKLQDQVESEDFSSYSAAQTEEAIVNEWLSASVTMRCLDLLVWHAIISNYNELAPAFRIMVESSFGKDSRRQELCWPLMLALDEWGETDFIEGLALHVEERVIAALAFLLLAGHEGMLDTILAKIDKLVENCEGDCNAIREARADINRSKSLLAEFPGPTEMGDRATVLVTYASRGFRVAFGSDPIWDSRRNWPLVRTARRELQLLDEAEHGRALVIHALQNWNVRTHSTAGAEFGVEGEDPYLDDLANKHNAAVRAFVKRYLSKETQSLISD